MSDLPSRFRFTQKAIEALPPNPANAKSTEAEYSDTQISGLKCLVGMLIITGVELLFGLIFNIILKEHVWDYSGVPLNFLGQVCVPFSLIWFALSGVAFKVIDTVQESIKM